jgi:hypothetical protein
MPQPGKILKPLLSTGNYGTHLFLNPAKTWSFVGSVPEPLYGPSFKTEEEGIQAFIAWFKSLPEDEAKVFMPKLRDDMKIAIA